MCPYHPELHLNVKHNYLVQAMCDYDYMRKFVERPKERDPFIVTSRRKVDHWGLRCALEDASEELDFCLDEPLEKENEPIAALRKASFDRANLENFALRVVMAIVGGAFLIGPMWPMVLHNTRYTALISTSVCVLVFGVIMAWVLDHALNVLSVTAAYAAVLVVFVGTNTIT
jgi:hypothetical protein